MFPNGIYWLLYKKFNHEYSFKYTFDKDGNLDLKLVEYLNN